MKNKIYFVLIFLLLFEIFISQSLDITKEVFPLYPYKDNMVTSFEDFCIKMKLKKNCMIEIAKTLDIQKIKNISYEFIKSYNNKEESSGLIKSSLNFLTYIYQNKIAKKFPGVFKYLESLLNEVKIWWNKYEEVIKEIEEILNDPKYQELVDKNLENDINELIGEGISQLQINDYIEDFFNNEENIDNNNYLNSIFKGNISSLNCFVLGEKNVNKTKFIETILEIKIKKENKKSNLRIYKNKKKKKGLKLSLIESKDDNDFENLNKEFYNITHKEKKFIYGFIYLGNTVSFIREKDKALVSLIEDHYDKIPLREINYKNGQENLSKKEFIEFIKEELNEDKLKSIYKYYYSLNFYEHFKNIITHYNLFINIFSSLLESDIIDIDAAANLIINKLKLNLNVLLLSPNLDYEDMNDKIKSFSFTFLKKLKEDLKKLNKDYNIDENKYFYSNWFSDKHPNDMIPIFLYEKISKLIEKVFFKKIKEIIVAHNFKIKYPNYSNIINIINNNFKDELPPQKKNNESEYISKLPEKSNNSLFDNKLIIFVVPTIIIIIIVGLIYCCFKTNENKNKDDQGEELENMNNENDENDENDENR